MPSDVKKSGVRELPVTEEMYRELATRAAAQGVSIADYVATLVQTTKTACHRTAEVPDP